jgi:CRP-like cAMP-binding protein
VIAWRRENRLQRQLARTPLLSSVGAADLARLATEGLERRYAEGDVIVHEGDTGGAFFIVLEGVACVSIDGVIVRAVGTGDVFGELALYGGCRDQRPSSRPPISTASC